MKIASISTEFNDIPNKISMTLFAAGCSRNCPGCQNESLKDFSVGVDLRPIELLHEYLSRPICNSVCFSGGDPIYQEDDLFEAMQLFVHQGIYVGLYTGESYENISDDIKRLADFMVTDPWITECGPVTSDTTNQRVWIRRNEKLQQTTYKELLNAR